MQLTLYSRPGCCLCEELREQITAYAHAVGVGERLAIQECDIDADDNWRELYGDRIPVVTHEGQVILEGRPSPEEVRLALHALDWGAQ